MIPYIIRATWQKDMYPDAKWIVVERKYNTFDACESFGAAIRYWLWHMGVSPKICFGWFKKKN